MTAEFTVMPRSRKQIPFRIWGSFSPKEAQWRPRKIHSLNKLCKQLLTPRKMYRFDYIKHLELKDLFYKTVVPILGRSVGFHSGVDFTWTDLRPAVRPAEAPNLLHWKEREIESFALLHTLQWRHNEHNGVSNHQPRDCLFNHFFRRRSNKTSKLRVTGIGAGKSPVTGKFPAQRASNAENVPTWLAWIGQFRRNWSWKRSC